MAWARAIGMMRQVGVADIKPEIAEQAATFWPASRPDSDTPSVPTKCRDTKRQAGSRSWSDDALNIMYVDTS